MKSSIGGAEDHAASSSTPSSAIPPLTRIARARGAPACRYSVPVLAWATGGSRSASVGACASPLRGSAATTIAARHGRAALQADRVRCIVTRQNGRECGAKRQTCAYPSLGASATDAPDRARRRQRPPGGGPGRSRARRNGASSSPSRLKRRPAAGASATHGCSVFRASDDHLALATTRPSSPAPPAESARSGAARRCHTPGQPPPTPAFPAGVPSPMHGQPIPRSGNRIHSRVSGADCHVCQTHGPS